MNNHEQNNVLTKLQLKAQLLGKIPLDQLKLKDTQEKIAVGFLRAAMDATEALDRLEVALKKVEENRKQSLWERIKRWWNLFMS